MLCDRLICGINDDRMQRCLLAESGLTFKKVYELAQAMETVDHDAKELQGPPPTAVNKLNKAVRAATRRSPPVGARTADHWNPPNSCYRCGQNHLASECRFRRSECRFCKKIGHIEKVCRSKLKQNRARGNANQTHNLSLSSEEVVDSNESPTTDEYSLYHVRSSRKPIMVILKLNGTPIAMELDTGAGTSIVSKQTFDQLWQRENNQHYNSHQYVLALTLVRSFQY